MPSTIRTNAPKLEDRDERRAVASSWPTASPTKSGPGQDGCLQEQEIDRASDSRLTDMLADNLYAGRTMKYYADLEIRDQSDNRRQTVLAAMKKYFDPKRLVVVVAGDFSDAEKTAEKMPKLGQEVEEEG